MILDRIKDGIKKSFGRAIGRLNTRLNGKKKYTVTNLVETDVFTQDGEYITSIEIPEVTSVMEVKSEDELGNTELRVSELEREIGELRDNMDEVSKMTRAWGNKEEKND